MNKTIALLVVGLIIVIACSTWIINEQMTKSDNEENESTFNTDIKEKKTLYFYKNTYVGYLSEGIWRMPVDVCLNEIFNNKAYTVYTNSYSKKTAQKIEIDLTDENCGFNFCDENGNLLDASQKQEILYKYSDKKNRELQVFNLPIELPEKIGKFVTKSLNNPESPSVKPVLDKGLFQKSVEENLVAFNDDYDVNFLNESEIDFIPEEVKQFLIDLFSDYNIENDLPHDSIAYYNYDLNNNESLDEIYYFDFNSTDSGSNINRNFSVILSRINNNFNALYKNVVLTDNTGNESAEKEKIDIYVADLNDDNYYEILYSVKDDDHSWNYLAYLKGNMFVNLYNPNYDYSLNFMSDLFNYENVDKSIFEKPIYKILLSYLSYYTEGANSKAQKNNDNNVYCYTAISDLSGDNTSYFYYGYFESNEELPTLKKKVDDFMLSSYAHESIYERIPTNNGIKQYNLKTSEENQDFIVNAEGELWKIKLLNDGTIAEQERLLPKETEI